MWINVFTEIVDLKMELKIRASISVRYYRHGHVFQKQNQRNKERGFGMLLSNSGLDRKKKLSVKYISQICQLIG